jgi:hypothetical protein
MLKQPDCHIVLVESYPCNSKDELCVQEQFYINAHNSNCINKNKAYTRMTLEEYHTAYRAEHKEQITKMKAKYKAEYKSST